MSTLLITTESVLALPTAIEPPSILILNGGLKKVAVFIWHHTPLSNFMIMHGSVGCLFR